MTKSIPKHGFSFQISLHIMLEKDKKFSTDYYAQLTCCSGYIFEKCTIKCILITYFPL